MRFFIFGNVGAGDADGSAMTVRIPKVLLAEDDLELRTIIARKLRNRGLDVIETASGLELAEVLVEHGAALGIVDRDPIAINLVITDVRMPGCTGLSIVSMLREHAWWNPVFVMSGFGDAALHAEAARLGVTAVFDKPFDLDSLANAACAALMWEPRPS